MVIFLFFPSHPSISTFPVWTMLSYSSHACYMFFPHSFFISQYATKDQFSLIFPKLICLCMQVPSTCSNLVRCTYIVLLSCKMHPSSVFCIIHPFLMPNFTPQISYLVPELLQNILENLPWIPQKISHSSFTFPYFYPMQEFWLRNDHTTFSKF